MLIQGTGLTTQRVGVGGYYFLLQECTEVLPGCCGWQRPEEEPFSQRSAIGITGGSYNLLSFEKFWLGSWAEGLAGDRLGGGGGLCP